MTLLSLSIARELAYDAFVAVLGKKQKPEEVLEKFYEKHENKLKRLDKNFIKEILYGSLRWYSKILWILQNTSKRDLDKSSEEIKAALVLGTYQIYYMDRVPDRAAVNESVEYIRKKGQASACSFVNGILRQIARRAKYFQKPDKITQPLEYLSLQYAHPPWVVERWLRQFKFEKLDVMLAANNKPPPITIRCNSMKVDLDSMHHLQLRLLKEEGVHSEKRHLRYALRLREYPPLGGDDLFGQGYYTMQDEASQLISYLVNPREGETIVDACSAPGGKLAHIYELGKEKINLIAIEEKIFRLERAKNTLARLGHLQVTWIESDFMEWKPGQKVDKILLDAPCSGLGVLRRHPEGKWLKTPEAFKSIVKNQYKMIQHALRSIKVGGELIFSVCSFEEEETTQHVKSLLHDYKEKIELISPVSRLPDYYKRYVTRRNLLLIYSGNPDDMDGFGSFIVKLKEDIE